MGGVRRCLLVVSRAGRGGRRRGVRRRVELARPGRGPARAPARRPPEVRGVRPVRRPAEPPLHLPRRDHRRSLPLRRHVPPARPALRAPPHRRPAQVARPRTARPRPAACAGSRSTAARCARASRSRCGRRPTSATASRCRCSPSTTAPSTRPRPSLTARAAAAIAAGPAPRAPHRPARPGPATSGTPPRRSTPARSAGEVLPAIGRAVAVAGPPAGMGASLGGLAMLHAQRRHPGTRSPALFLQSASFFIPRFDHMEKGFARYGRIVRFVRGIAARDGLRPPVPVDADLRAAEDNVHNNRASRPRCASRAIRRRSSRRRAGTTSRPGAARSTRTSRDLLAGLGRALMERRHVELWAPGSTPTASSSPTATSAARCSSSRPSAGGRGSTRTAGWSTRSPG